MVLGGFGFFFSHRVDEFPNESCILSSVTGLNCSFPLVSVWDSDVVRNLVVELQNMGVGRVKCSRPVSSSNERFSFNREGFETIANEAYWNMMFGCGLEYVVRTFLAGEAGCWRRFPLEPQLLLRRLVRPPSFPYVFLRTAWVGGGDPETSLPVLWWFACDQSLVWSLGSRLSQVVSGGCLL